LADAVGPEILAAVHAGVGGGTQRGQGAECGVLEQRGQQSGRHDQRPGHVAHQLGVGAARMSRRRDSGSVRGQPALQLVSEQQVGELGLPVRTHPAVAAFPVQVVKMDGSQDAVADAADRYYTRAGDGQQPVE
jgi:hypothetical protein